MRIFGLFICFSCMIACNHSAKLNPENDFVEYIIQAGEQYSSNNTIRIVDNISEMKFIARFDSTAIYTSLDSINQYDINKLYGFSDNNTMHHANSARIGWCWLHQKLQLFGYIYNDSVRSSQYIKSVALNTNIDCSIKVATNKYIFTIDGTTITMPRTATIAKGYQLFPYFGGDEVAPHLIRIWIKDNSVYK